MPDPRDDRPDGRVESDDTTQADAGMVGGTGADEGQATVSPQATQPHDDDEDSGQDE